MTREQARALGRASLAQRERERVDAGRVAAALGFYIDRCHWGPHDQDELTEYRRLLAAYEARS